MFLSIIHYFWLTAYPSTRISIATFPTRITFLTIRNLLISLFVSSSFGFWSFGLFRLKIRTSFSSFFNNFESTNSTRSDRPKSTQDWRTKWFDSWRSDCSTILRTMISYNNVFTMTSSLRSYNVIHLACLRHIDGLNCSIQQCICEQFA